MLNSIKLRLPANIPTVYVPGHIFRQYYACMSVRFMSWVTPAWYNTMCCTVAISIGPIESARVKVLLLQAAQ